MLAVVQTHPVQYHAPVFRALHQQCGVPLQVIYASDFSVAGYRDAGFGLKLAWDADLLSGYPSRFLARVADGGPRSFEEVSGRGVAAALSRLRPSAVLVCGYRPHFHRAAFFQAWRSGCAVLFRAETTDAEPRGRVATAVRRAALRMLYDRCARLLYIGERSRRHFESLRCDASRLVFSPYCTDTASFQADEAARVRLRAPLREALGVGPDDLVLLFAGKLTSKKRPDLLVQAMRRLRTSSPRPVVGFFLGDGGLRGELETAVAREPRVRAHFAGFKNQSELSPYYHVADLLVLPSQHSETWGIVVNEALCHGLPSVVSSAVGCAADLVKPGETGEVFDVGSAEGLEAAILRALRLVDRGEIRVVCRRLADQYSVERAAVGIANAYRSVVDLPAN
jgi:glycosyltransferase involved in cell wall biosynthesis